MHMMIRRNRTQLIVSLLALTAGAGLSGCAMSARDVVSAPATVQAMLQGRVHGGQQPVTGSTIQLYKANLTTAYSYSGGSTPLIASTITTDSTGSFTITGAYTCQPGDLLYITATGGNPGVSGTQNNSALTMMAGLGPCASVLGTNRYIFINELTTVASVWSLGRFISSITAVNAAPTNILGITQAFATIDKIVNTATGTLAGPALPTGATLPLSEINTLADILAVCINSVNSGSTQSTQCTNVFAPIYSGLTDTVSAAIYLAHSPATGLSLYSMANAAAPFQPTLSAAPTAWTIAINYVGGGLNVPRGIAVDFSGNIWVANSGNNSVTELSNTGAAISGAAGFTAGAIRSPVALAIDLNNNVWIANSGNSTVTELSNSGATGTAFSGGGLNVPSSIAIDASNNVWVTNLGNSSVTELSNSGTPVSSSAGFTGGGISKPGAIAIDPD
jgi:hypothetical protein